MADDYSNCYSHCFLTELTVFFWKEDELSVDTASDLPTVF